MTSHASEDTIDDLFLFAHQDDEFAAVHVIEDGNRYRRRQFFVFLTNGKVEGGADSDVRNTETLNALARLGVNAAQVAFVGTVCDLPDGSLYQHLPRALAGLEEAIGQQQVGRVVLPAWEGGHHDHDAVHLVGLALARRRDCVERSVQVPFYRAKPGFPGIVMFSPLAANGEALAHKRTLSEVAAHLAMSRHYPTQMRHFAGILPLALLHYLGDRKLYTQPLNASRVLERPTERIKYEGRHELSFAEFQAAVSIFVATEITGAKAAS